jgi:pimeloyl-ACP methyl ester carboxylesterase
MTRAAALPGLTARAHGVRVRDLYALGLRTRLLEAGPSDAVEAVVFLHGAPGSAEDWKHLLPVVARFARAVAFDFPGFGQADKPADWDYTSSGFALFIAAALKELGICRAHLVMVDIGGLGCLWGAAHPDSFASAVLINAGVPLQFRWHILARLHQIPVVGFLVALTAKLGFRTVFGHYEPILPRDELARWGREYVWGTRRAMLRLYRATPPGAFARMAPVLQVLDRPALVIWGARDRFVKVEQANHQRESFPSAEVIVLDDSGHYPPLDAPDRVIELAVPFLKTQLGVSDSGATGAGRDQHA